MSSLAQYVTLCQQEVDDTSNGATAVITQRIKEVVQEILRQTKQYLCLSVTNDRTATPGTALYTPQEFVEIALHYKPEGGLFTRLKEITQEDYLDKYINDEDGTPHSYFLDDSSYRLVPAPADAGTIRETLQVVQEDPNGNSVVPDRYTNVVILGVTERFKGWENNLGAAGNYYGPKFKEALRDMVLELATRNKPVRIKIYGRNK